MASFGHVAVGLLTGRLHGGGPAAPRRRCSWRTLAIFATLAALPDADVLLVGLGVSDSGPFGHRRAFHSLPMAVVVGLVCAVAAARAGWPVLRTALAGTAAVASHALLDLLGHGGRPLMVFWPLSTAGFRSPWRLLPDSPRGMKLLSGAGLGELALEFLLFSPITLYALWPQLRARPRPELQLLDGGGAPSTPQAQSPNSGDQDPALRSSG